MSNLRKVWVVIHGENPPQGEIENANGIADYLRKKFNLVRVLPANAQAIDLLSRFCNFVLVGGPIANEWVFNLNEYVNPKYNIIVHREKTPDESWAEYVASGAFEVLGILKDTVAYASRVGLGLLGKGAQPYPRARPLQIMSVGGWDYGDTCTMGKAFRNGERQGIYNCTYPTITHEDPCPLDETMSYVLIADP